MHVYVPRRRRPNPQAHQPSPHFFVHRSCTVSLHHDVVMFVHSQRVLHRHLSVLTPLSDH